MRALGVVMHPSHHGRADSSQHARRPFRRAWKVVTVATEAAHAREVERCGHRAYQVR